MNTTERDSRSVHTGTPVTDVELIGAPFSPFDFSEEQRRMIRDTYANGATDAEFAVLMEIAKARRLNPLLRQIHFVSRWDSEKRRPVWAAQVSIDGLRAIAERTGVYHGQDEPEFVENPDGTLRVCKVRVWRRDWPRPAVGIAYWDEYVQFHRDRNSGESRPTSMWGRMPHVMISKCAEALALRKAFPEDMSGLYTPEEMMQATNDAVPTTARPKVGVSTAQPANDAPTVRPDFRGLDDALVPLYAGLAALRTIEDAVALWQKNRSAMAPLARREKESAWNALCRRVEEVTRSRDATASLRAALAREPATTAAPGT